MPMRHVAAIVGICIGVFVCVAAVLLVARILESTIDLYR